MQNENPVQLKTIVECPIEDSFELFTEHFAEWWPHSEPHDAAILHSDPPHKLCMRWDRDEHVEVTFRTVAIGTEITVTHTIAAAMPSFARFVSQALVAA